MAERNTGDLWSGFLVACIWLMAFLLVSCAGNSTSKANQTKLNETNDSDKSNETEGANGGEEENRVANPASTHCEQKGGRVDIMSGGDGQFGVCIFNDGSRCEEWRYFRGECAPGQCHESDGICSP